MNKEKILVKLKDYTEKQYKSGKTKNLRDYAKDKGIEINKTNN